MTLEKKVAALFQMDDETWRRHANPWSVWSRFTVAPLLILACWSRVWLGWWALVPVAVALLWTWGNPRLFASPETMDSWAAKGVLGERVWMNRDEVPVPAHHQTVPHMLSAASAVGTGFVIYGVIVLALWPTIFGWMLMSLAKLWFVDRMAWLYEDMKDATPAYQEWGAPREE